ncbi:MAG TPA: DNA repair protein RadC [Candidatus Brocadiia bacterium]|nr:DNA repair protein RadC [Candidatus Brocadiia bacterium]
MKEIPEDERPRERLLKCGADALSEAELLAIIIRDGTPEMSAVGLAHALLARFGSLRNLSRAGAPEITKVKGIGKAKAAQILAALAVGRRASSETARTGDLFDSPERVFDYFRAGFRDLKQETFHVVLLDTKHRLLKTSRIFAGTLNLSTVHPREIFNEAIRESAAAVIFVHNHPSGDPTPSREDIALTKRLKEVGELVGIKALDHVIIGGDGFTSLASLGIV